MVVQYRWVETAGNPTDLIESLGSDFPEPKSMGLYICQVSRIVQGTQTDQKRGQQLAGFVMQFSRNAAPFLLLSRKHALQEKLAHRLCLFDFCGLLALGDVARHGGSTNDLAFRGLDRGNG